MDITLQTTFDTPVKFKKATFHPITLRDYFSLQYFGQCLTLDKNSTPDIKVIQMTYLEYLYHCTKTDIEHTPYLIWLDRVFAMSIKDDRSFDNPEESISRYKYGDKGRGVFFIGEEEFSGADFEIIRRIICDQNLLEMPDENISKEVRDSMEKARRYKQKLSGARPGSLEDYVVSLATATGWTLEYIYGMSIRKFVKSIRRLDNLIHYKIYLAASMSGMVEFKDTSFIKHWLTDIETEDNYDDVSVDLDAVKGKISLEGAKTPRQ